MCARRSGNIFYSFFADNFTGAKDTKPYKTDVSFLCQYMYSVTLVHGYKPCENNDYLKKL